jgi:rhodanese-related sulfurtransferase
MKKHQITKLISGIVMPCFLLMAFCSMGCKPKAKEVEFADVKTLMAEGEAAIIDVRPVAAFENGCIQDARNIDVEDLIDQYGDIIDSGSALTSVVADKSKKLLLYCDGYGKDKQFADAAIKLGYKKVNYYAGGIADWQGVHGDYLVIAYNAFKGWHDDFFPFEAGTNYLISANLNSWYTGAEVQLGHIPGAVNLPSPEVATRAADGTLSLVDEGKALTDLITDKTAKVIIYCGSITCGRSKDVADAAVMLGYTKVYRYQGGYAEWIAEGNSYVSGNNPY